MAILFTQALETQQGINITLLITLCYSMATLVIGGMRKKILLVLNYYSLLLDEDLMLNSDN